ncbi:MAG: hypothetical protein SWZ49_24430 [Cyanobacteriota bacterium]|nr:hypothetical protein [Cyanobacteriota bacterium]
MKNERGMKFPQSKAAFGLLRSSEEDLLFHRVTEIILDFRF